MTSHHDMTAVVAVDKAWCIGKQGEIPWHLPDDLKQFKRLTSGHVLIMGRKTHESIGRALPGRRNIVLTRQPDYRAAQGCEVCVGIDALWPLLESEQREVFVIGGAAIYEALMPWTVRCVLTAVDLVVEEGDVYFPALNVEGWELVGESTRHDADAQHAHTFVVHELVRREDAPWRALDPGGQLPEEWRA